MESQLLKSWGNQEAACREIWLTSSSFKKHISNSCGLEIWMSFWRHLIRWKLNRSKIERKAKVRSKKITRVKRQGKNRRKRLIRTRTRPNLRRKLSIGTQMNQIQLQIQIQILRRWRRWKKPTWFPNRLSRRRWMSLKICYQEWRESYRGAKGKQLEIWLSWLMKSRSRSRYRISWLSTRKERARRASR